MVASMLEAVFAQSLAKHGVAEIEHFGAVIFVGAVDAVWPHVLGVAVES